ncbi:MAG: hypothetical protein ABSG04_14040 [Verrucomicrobiota bacterium]
MAQTHSAQACSFPAPPSSRRLFSLDLGVDFTFLGSPLNLNPNLNLNPDLNPNLNLNPNPNLLPAIGHQKRWSVMRQ